MSDAHAPGPRVALVTGSTSGIGLAIAERLCAEGFHVAFHSRSSAVLGRELAARHPGASYTQADLADDAQTRRLAAEVLERHGRLDVLVNNAGVGFGSAVGEMQTKRVDMMLDLNLRSPVLFYRESVEMLREAGAEHRNALVVNTASIAGKSGQAWLSVYAATKAALVNFTESMNKELSNDGIKSTALCPAFVDTPMTDFAKSNGVEATDMIRPEDIAESVRFLLTLSPACIVPEIQFVRPGELGL